MRSIGHREGKRCLVQDGTRGGAHSSVTWVIGTPTFLGYGVAISDIRVSWPDGTSRDCLLKIYPVARFIAAGFSGSVRFGFWAISDLRRQLHLDDPARAWIPGKAVFRWYRRARHAFAKAPEADRNCGASIMLVGVSPDVDLGIPGWARPMVAIMRAPDFFPRVLKINAVEAIGSGAAVDAYIKELQELTRDAFPLQQLEVGGRGGFGVSLMHVIQSVIEEHPDARVSPHVHLCLVRRGQIQVLTNNHTVFAPNSPPVEIRMPSVATTWAEFQKLCSDMGVEVTAATC